jgi:hypothetical protein
MTTHRRLYYSCQHCQIAHWEGEGVWEFHKMFAKAIKVSEFVEEVFSTVLMEHELE